jgi:2-polyprenyl-3-methyl-5-hydroxy-6-metoxy-1,4-benzoquinol methylase
MILPKQFANLLAQSFLFKRGRETWKRNEVNWNLPLTRLDKVVSGGYLILSDYASGAFPPEFLDQQRAYDAEINYMSTLPGVSVDESADSQMRKPFWYGRVGRNFLGGFIELLEAFEKLGICPPQRILELGCGIGWMAEFLALMKYEVVATSISPLEIKRGETRVQSIAAKGLEANLRYLAAPMETIDQTLQKDGLFDAVYVYEALHHAYDWPKAVKASYACLKPGGWLILGREPNILHTFISYRVARLTHTHEIGFKRSDLLRQLATAGFNKTIVARNRFDLLVKPHWIAAQK